MERRELMTLVAAVCIAAAGVGFGLRAAGCLSRPAPIPATPADTQSMQRLEAIEDFLQPTTPEERASAAKAVAQQAAAILQSPSFVRPPGEPVRRTQNEAALLRLVEARVRLLLDPDYDAYVRHVGEVMGRDGTAVLSGTMFEDKKLWTSFASAFQSAGIAPEAVVVLAGPEHLQPDSLMGGHRTTLEDTGIYGSKAVVDAGGEVRDLVVPMLFFRQPGSEPAVLTVFITLSFVWDATRSRWLPFKAGVHDPSGVADYLPVPWI